MKRTICTIDDYLPNSFQAKDTLNSINQLTVNIDNLIRKKKRTNVLLNSIHSSSTAALPSHVSQKIMRIFIRHDFYSMASCVNEKPYFLLYIDGLILHSSSSSTAGNNYCIGNYFDRISVQTDKKYNLDSQSYEWKYEHYPIGSTANGYRIKIKCPKSNSPGGEVILPCKISLSRSTNVTPRYNISDQLRMLLLPNIRIDPTEKEVLLAVWQYILTRNLTSADKKMVICDDNLRELFFSGTTSTVVANTLTTTSTSIFPISSLKQKILIHLVLTQPINVEYILHTVNTTEIVNATLKSNCVSIGGGRWSTAAAYSKIGGKVFDIEVDTWNQYSIEMINAMNKLIITEYEVEDKTRMYQEKLAYLISSIQKHENENVVTLSENDTDNVTKSSNTATNKSILPLTCVLSIFDRIKYRSIPEKFDASFHSKRRNNTTITTAITTAGTNSNNLLLHSDSNLTIPTKSSSLHALTGYIDVGDDILFSNNNIHHNNNGEMKESNSKTNWVTSACRQIVENVTAVVAESIVEVNHSTNNNNNNNIAATDTSTAKIEWSEIIAIDK